jgi:hypothetical protein
MHLRAALHAEARLLRAVALALVDPGHADEPAASRDLGERNMRKGRILDVVSDLLALRGAPALGVVEHGGFEVDRVGASEPRGANGAGA